MRTWSQALPAALLGFLAASDPAQAAAAPVCGDGVQAAEEACDLGIGNEVGRACTPACTRPVCGDGFVAPSEPCDDGNAADGDGCSSACGVEGRPRWVSTLQGSEPGDELLLAVATTRTGLVAVGRRETAWQVSVPIVVAFDADGRLRWTDETSSHPGPASANAVLAIGSEAIVAGTTYGDDGAAIATLWRYDAAGALMMSTELAIEAPGEATALAALSTDRAIVAGSRTVGPNHDVGWIGEIDVQSGALSWRVDVPGEGTRSRGIYGIAVAPGGRLVATGWFSTATGWRAWVGAFTATGESIWIHAVPPVAADWSSDFGTAVAVDARGDAFVVGSRLVGYTDSPWSTGGLSDYDVWVGAFAEDGSVRWIDGYGDPDGLADFGGGIVLDAEGRPIVSASVHTRPLLTPAPWDRDVWLRRYDRDGAVEWTQTWDGDMHGLDGAEGLVLDDDGSILVAGQSSVVFEGTTAMLARLYPPVSVAGDAAPAHAGRATAQKLGITPPIAADLPDEEPSRRAAPGRHRSTLFIDFAGGELRPGSDATRHEASCLDAPIVYPGFSGDGQAAQAIAQMVTAAMSGYGVAVRWEEEPPPHLPFTRVMVGGSAEQIGLDAAAAGYACVIDCGDAVPSDLAFAFERDDVGTIAGNVLHEAGHTWGLDHVVDESALMNPFVAGADRQWMSGCSPVSDATNAPGCVEWHARHCPDGGQNSRAELLDIFGAAGPDVQPPLARLVRPRWGEEVEPGTPVRVELRVGDDLGGAGYRLVVPTLEWTRVGTSEEATLELALPPGVHDIRLEAIDHAGNEASTTVRVGVGAPVPDSRPAHDAPTEEDDDAPKFGAAEPGDGCSCRSTRRTVPVGWGWLMLAGIGASRARARSSLLQNASRFFAAC